MPIIFKSKVNLTNLDSKHYTGNKHLWEFVIFMQDNNPLEGNGVTSRGL